MNKKLTAALAASHIVVPLIALLAFAPQVKAEEVDEIIVSATGIPTPAAQIGASVDVITAEDLERQQITYLQDALKTVAGISTYQSGGPGSTSNVFMRGMTGKYSGVYVDGVQINDPVSQQAAWAYLPTHGLESVEVLRGSQSVLYGSEAIGGAISMFTAVGGENQNRIDLQAGSFGTNNIALSSRGEVRNLDYGLAIKQTDSDGISAANENDGNTEEDGYESLSARGRFVVDISENFSFDLALRSISSEIETDTSGPRDDPDDYTDFDATGGSASLVYGTDQWQHRLSFGQNQDVTTSNSFSKTTTIGERQATTLRSVYRLSDTTDLLFGLESEADELVTASGGTYEVETEAAFVLGQYSDGKGLSASVAARQDDHDEFGSYDTYRIAGRQMFGAFGVRASYGTGFRAPSLDENFGEANYCLDGVCGAVSLQPEESESSDIAVIFEPNARLQVDLAYFKIEISNLIKYGSVTPANPSAPCLDINRLFFGAGASTCGRYEQSDDDSQSSGYELRGRFDLGSAIRLTGNYTKLDAETETGARDIRRPEQTLNLAANAIISERLSVSGGVLAVQDIIDTDFNNGNAQVKLDDYAVVTIGFAYHLNDQAKVSGRVTNLLDDEYETALGFGTPGRAFYVGVTSSF